MREQTQSGLVQHDRGWLHEINRLKAASGCRLRAIEPSDPQSEVRDVRARDIDQRKAVANSDLP